MLAYKVKLNGRKLTTVGMEEDGLIFVKAAWLRLPAAKGITTPRKANTFFTVSGLRDKTKEHLDWARTELKPGDKITIELVETDQVDEPKEISKLPRKK